MRLALPRTLIHVWSCKVLNLIIRPNKPSLIPLIGGESVKTLVWSAEMGPGAPCYSSMLCIYLLCLLGMLLDFGIPASWNEKTRWNPSLLLLGEHLSFYKCKQKPSVFFDAAGVHSYVTVSIWLFFTVQAKWGVENVPYLVSVIKTKRYFKYFQAWWMRKKAEHVRYVRLLNSFSPSICGAGQWQTLKGRCKLPWTWCTSGPGWGAWLRHATNPTSLLEAMGLW